MSPGSAFFQAWSLPPDVTLGDPSLVVGGERHGVVQGLAPTPGLIRRGVTSLREGHRGLADRPWRSIAESVGSVAERLLGGSDPLLEEALAWLRLTTSFSPAMCDRIVEGMARDWTFPQLAKMVEAEGLDGPLDGFVQGESGSLLRARGRPLNVHLGAGSVPGVSVTSMIRALLVKSAVWVKPGRGDVVLPVLVARALAENDVGLASAVAVSYWPGDQTPRELLAAADVVVAYGGNDTVEAVRSSLPATTALVAYHHRLSVGVVAREALTDQAVSEDVARAIAMFDQRGCVSPHLLFVERGGGVSPDQWAQGLAGTCEEVAASLPPGDWTHPEASAVQQLRAATELRGAVDSTHTVRQGDSLAWTVVVDPTAGVTAPTLARTVILRPVDDLDEVAGLLADVGRVLQTVGWAGPTSRARDLAERLSRVGVTRVCSYRAQPFPPSWWRHDGQPPLAPLVRWSELEVEDRPYG